MTGDLRSSILTTAAVAASVAGLTIVQPLIAAPPLLLASLLMDRGSGDSDGVSSIADAIQGKLLPSDGKTVIIDFLTGPFGIWNPLDQSDRVDGTVPSTIGVASSLPFLSQRGLNIQPPTLPPTPAALPGVAAPPPGQVVAFDIPSLQIGAAITSPPPGPVPVPRDVVTTYGYDLQSYDALSALNPFALTNSLAAHLNGAMSPVEITPDGDVVCRQRLCDVDELDIVKTPIANGYIITFTTPDGVTFTARVEKQPNGQTKVTYDDSGPLPLVRPLRDYGGLLGNELADVLEPALTALVYWGYRDATGETGNGLLPTPAETIQTLLDFIVGVKQGVESLFEAHQSGAADSASTVARVEDVATAVEEFAPEKVAPVAEAQPAKDPSVVDPAPVAPVQDVIGDVIGKLPPVLQPVVDKLASPGTEGPATEEPAEGETDEDTGDQVGDPESDAEDQESEDKADEKADKADAKDEARAAADKDADKDADNEGDKDDVKADAKSEAKDSAS